MNELVEEVNEFENIQEESLKPELQKYWPYLLVISFLSCLAVLFVSAIELKIIILSISVSLILVSLSRIIGHDAKMAEWYRENPDQIPDKMKKRKYRKSNKSRSISIKK